MTRLPYPREAKAANPGMEVTEGSLVSSPSSGCGALLGGTHLSDPNGAPAS